MTMKLSRATAKPVLAVLAALVLTGCTASEGARDNPLLRKFQWFSYMEGGDFKDTCGPGAPSIYRMVYNAVYTEQVRIYELDPQANTLAARVFGKANLRHLSISSLNDLLNPWRGTEAVTRVSASDVQGLLGDLDASGAFGPPNVGAELSSKGFFWTIAACHEGQYHFTGFAWPGTAWDRARFTGRLFALDRTGVAVNDPRKTVTDRKLGENKTSSQRVDTRNQYHVKVGENGLDGFQPLF